MGHAIRGFGRWKPGVILKRKPEEEINGQVFTLKGYDILDTVTGKHTTRTREDIRRKKKSKIEDKIYKEYVEFLNKMHQASNDRAEGEEYKKPLFQEHYEDIANTRTTPKDLNKKPNNQPEENPTAPDHPPEESGPNQPEQPEE